MKLQLHRDAICINDPKGIRKLVELVGGSWGQIPLEKKFELAEKAVYKCIQKSDESSDSYVTRCEVVWTEMLARNMQLGELQAYIMLRGSRLSAEDKKSCPSWLWGRVGRQLGNDQGDVGGTDVRCRVFPRDDRESKGQKS